MTNTTGPYPRLKVDTTASGAVGQAGGVLVTETIAVSGVGRELSAALSRWRKPLAIHDPVKVITDLAVTLALGGDCLADIALLRSEPGVYGLVASDATVSRTIDAAREGRPRCPEGHRRRPRRGPKPRMGTGRNRFPRLRHQREESADRGPGRNPGRFPLREGAGSGHVQARLRLPSIVLIH